MSRSIVVDDNDSGIVYSGSWFKDDSGDLNTMGNFGPPTLGTLHGTNSTASFTYSFTGTSFIVSNSNQFNNPTGLNITCNIDGQSVPVIISTVPVNNVLLCNKDGLADGPHTFVLNAVVTNQETFWFDTLTYVPSPSTSLDKFLVSIGQDDEALQAGLSAGWKTFSPGFETTQTGAGYTFSFRGVSLTWYGFYDPSLPWDTSIKTATYSVDGGTPIAFNTLTDVASRTDKPTGVRYNQVLFQTDDFPAGNHNLTVTYQGTNSSTPLTLEYLLVSPNPRAATAVSTPTSSSSPLSASSTIPTTSTPSSPSGSPRKMSNIGAIVGGIVAAVAVFALLAILFVFIRKRRRNGYRRPTSVLTPEMAEPVLPPHTVPDQNRPRRSYTHPSESTIASANSLSSRANNSYSTQPDPFLDSRSIQASAGSSYPPTSPSTQPYGTQSVELTPSGRILHSSGPSPTRSGKGPIPMRVATTVVQDEDSGVRLGQRGSQNVEILPPSYSEN